MIILGIDPGYDRLGWGVVARERGTVVFLDCGIIQTSKQLSSATRLHVLHQQLSAIMLIHKPTIVAIETLFLAHNEKTVIKVAEARGIVLLAADQHGCTVAEYSPLQVKSTVAGDGRSDKKTVEKMLRLQLPAIPPMQLDDTIDGISLAFTHATCIR